MAGLQGEIPSQLGRTAVVTGATGGLGYETALALAKAGAEVILTGRDDRKGQSAIEKIGHEVNGAKISYERLDLASLASVADFATRMQARPSLDLLINNAGVMALPRRQTTPDGFEMQFGTNHLGHFVFINRIAPLLHKGSRVINLSSAGHRLSNVNLEDPNFAHTDYEPFAAYGRSKTANILFSVAFDRRYRARGICAAAVHPGVIQTELGRHIDPARIEALIDQIRKEREAQGKGPFEWKTIPQGAATSVWAAVVADADEIGGRYCENCHVAEIVPDNVNITGGTGGVRAYALDPHTAEALWEKSEEMVGERF